MAAVLVLLAVLSWQSEHREEELAAGFTREDNEIARDRALELELRVLRRKAAKRRRRLEDQWKRLRMPDDVLG